MIKQCAVTDIKSRSECNVFDNTGFLPVIVAPMYSCVDRSNVHIFLENKIKVCMPRKEYMDESYKYCSEENYFDSYSLQEFIDNFIKTKDGFLTDIEGHILKTSICIDTATGHLKVLHEAIRKAKEIHGDNLIIMAGNVSSVEAFIELAKTGCDYIRVGVGGGSGCNTSLQTGVGQKDLEKLVKKCYGARFPSIEHVCTYNDFKEGKLKGIYGGYTEKDEQEHFNVSKVKIVADGISRFIDQLIERKKGLDNGYAAINCLLYAGADLVMVGKLFAQCVESAGEKALHHNGHFDTLITNNQARKLLPEVSDYTEVKVKYQGMSTKEAQMRYKELVVSEEYDKTRHGNLEYSGHLVQSIKPSEGKTLWIPVKWTLEEWLNSSETDNDYLPGWINSLRSAMSYTGSKTLKEFKQ